MYLIFREFGLMKILNLEYGITLIISTEKQIQSTLDILTLHILAIWPILTILHFISFPVAV